MQYLYLIGLGVLIGIFLIWWFFGRDSKSDTPVSLNEKQKEIQEKMATASIARASIEKIQGDIQTLRDKEKQARDAIQLKEEQIKKEKERPTRRAPLANPKDAANWVRSLTSKKKKT